MCCFDIRQNDTFYEPQQGDDEDEEEGWVPELSSMVRPFFPFPRG